MNVRLTLENARAPKRMNPTDAGADLFSPSDFTMKAGQVGFIDLGIQIELENGTVGLIFPRGGLASRKGLRLRNTVGVIDAKYRDNIGLMLENSGDFDITVEKGDRIAQLVVVPILTPEFNVVEHLDTNGDRGGGFGSSGR